MGKFSKTSFYLIIPLIFGVSCAFIYTSLGGPSINTQKQEQTTEKESTLVVTPSVTIDEFPPLNSGVEWDEPKTGKYLFIDKNNQTQELNGRRISGSTTEIDSGRFIEEMSKQLDTDGWIQTLDAGGPTGIFLGYQKDEKNINFGVEFIPDGQGPNEKIVEYIVFIEYSN